MSHRILITGSVGLVGTSLRAALEARGVEVVGLDLLGKGVEYGDVRDKETVRAAMAGCAGVVHLAAVSRVVWAEKDPEACRHTNVGGITNVIEVTREEPTPPWILFASSREVYGQPERLPATEESPIDPVNIYGCTKVEGERRVLEVRDCGVRTAVVRLSNVYGTPRDHADRVVPAFARAAVLGNELRVDGADHTFDFTHIDDTCRGIVRLIDILASDAPLPPPIHLLTGRPTTLGELAALAVKLGRSESTIKEAPPRSYDVSHFFGSLARADELLDWRAQIDIAEGLARLVADFRLELEVEVKL